MLLEENCDHNDFHEKRPDAEQAMRHEQAHTL